MDIKQFVLSYYSNATKDFHITKITAPSEALKLHSHSYFQVYYVIKGKIIHHIENNSATLTSGDVFVLPPDIPHYIEASEDVDFYSMSFMPDFFMGTHDGNKLIDDFLYYLKNATFEKIHPKLSLSYNNCIFVEPIFKRIMYEFESSNTGKSELIKECVSVLLSLFARVYFEEKADALNTTLKRNSILHCIEYINNHFDDDITLSEIIKLSAMSKTSFCTLFSSHTGQTFKNYLNNVRIKKATELISKGKKITNVSICCGYSDFSTFYRNFKKYMNMSPMEYQIAVLKEN